MATISTVQLKCDMPGCASSALLSEVPTDEPWLKVHISVELVDKRSQVAAADLTFDVCRWHRFAVFNMTHDQVMELIQERKDTQAALKEAQEQGEPF